MEEYQFDDYTENMYVEKLSFEEANSIFMPILAEFNQAFDILIDFFEEEDLKNKDLENAKGIVEDFLSGDAPAIQRLAAMKILKVIEKAIETKTYVCFEF